MKLMRTYIFISLLLLWCSNASGKKIDLAFSALQQFDYFKAKNLFESSIKKNKAAANFGLAVIYSRNDNPFFLLDSALTCIQRAEKSYSATSEKEKTKLKKYQFNYPAIDSLRQLISKKIFELISSNFTIQNLSSFQQTHSWSPLRMKAAHLRDSLALNVAINENNANAFNNFLTLYPKSDFYTEAQSTFFRLQYQESTKSNTIASFVEFLANFPTNPFIKDAQDQLFLLTTKRNTYKDYEAFIKSYPQNSNVDLAWNKLSQTYLTDFSKETVNQFLKDYPDYPFKDQLLSETELNLAVWLPYKQNGSYGWMNSEGEIQISAVYGSVGFFHEGLAFAEQKDLFGFVNKKNEWIVQPIYESVNDFFLGRAIVEKNGKFGCIDRSGSLILQAIYDDIGQLSNGLMFVQKDSLFGYVDEMGYQRIPMKYQEAFNFEEGEATITIEETQGIIDRYGAFVLRPEFESIRKFSKNTFVYEEADFYKFINRNGQKMEGFMADNLGALSSNLAYFEYDGEFGYIDSNAKIIIPLQFNYYTNARNLAQFQHGFARVAKTGKYGMIDKTGKYVIPAIHLNLGVPSKQLISFEKAGKWGYLNLQNMTVIPPTYEYAESFQNGLGIVQNLTLRGAVDATNKIVIPLNHTSVSVLDQDHFLVTIGAKHGVYTNAGKLVVPIEYGQYRKVENGFYLLNKGVEMHYFDPTTNRLIIPHQ